MWCWDKTNYSSNFSRIHKYSLLCWLKDIKKFGTLHLDEEYFVGYPSEDALNEVPENVEFQLKSIEDRIGRFRNSFQTILVSLENINQKKLEHSNELKKISQFFGSLLDGECAAIHCSIESCGNCESLVQECNHIKNGFIKISEIFDESVLSLITIRQSLLRMTLLCWLWLSLQSWKAMT